MFRMSAVGRITVALSPNKVIVAMYPEAPACPTDEYKNAISAIAKQRRASCVVSTSIRVVEALVPSAYLFSSVLDTSTATTASAFAFPR